MIYPTRLAVILMTMGAPVCLLLGILRPGLWSVGVAWVAALGALMLVDAVLCASARSLDFELETPGAIPVGRPAEVTLRAGFTGLLSPRTVDVALETNDKLALDIDRGTSRVGHKSFDAAFEVTPLRRGEGALTNLWMRWRGPLGLVWRQRNVAPDRKIPIIPNIRAVRDEAIRLFSRTSLFGMKI